MSIPDVADLVVIAAPVLDIDTREALDLIDLPAEAALARARNRRGEPASFETRGRADDGGSASRRRVRACGFSSPVAPGTWAGTSSAS
jgi:hypothetical protein